MITYLQERMKKAKADDGFTLIELLIVVIILGVLATVVIFSIQGLTDDSQDAACRTDKRIMATAEEAYFASVDPSTYGTEAQLDSSGFIDEESDYWNIANVTATGYDLVVEDPDCA